MRRVAEAAFVEPAQLVARIVGARDREAFRTLFLMFAPRVKTYLIRRGASVAVADELAQETLLTVWRKAEYYRADKASVAAWVFTIARNLQIDAVRKERSALAYGMATPEEPDAPATPESERDAGEREARLRAAIQALPPPQIDVIRLSFFSDKPHSEIAQDLGLPLGTVKSRLRLAVLKLRAALGDLA
jgi:RNA polymerase sigma-70 factor (ECF subfamily)